MDRLRLADCPDLRVWGGWPYEAPQPGSPAVLEWVNACEVKPLIIVDSLSAFFSGDQNDATEMRAFMHGCPFAAESPVIGFRASPASRQKRPNRFHG